MQKLLADYLFQNKACALPQVGLLSIKNTSSSTIFGEHLYAAPIPKILYSNVENNTADLEHYIAFQNNISLNEAQLLLQSFSQNITTLAQGEKAEIKQVGEFYKNENEEICFTACEINEHFFPKTKAERVIHPNTTHSMLVGEKETDTAAMTEYYTDDEQSIKSKWWIAALILAVVSIAAIAFYFTESKGGNSFFGNSNAVQVNSADSTYHILP
jgi:hypothetical protein